MYEYVELIMKILMRIFNRLKQYFIIITIIALVSIIFYPRHFMISLIFIFEKNISNSEFEKGMNVIGIIDDKRNKKENTLLATLIRVILMLILKIKEKYCIIKRIKYYSLYIYFIYCNTNLYFCFRCI